MSAAAGEVLSTVRSQGLIEPGQAVLVLLSGGRDSVCLLDVTVTLAGTGAVSALHLNYGLRDSADGDERHCRELCERLGVELTVHKPGPPPSGNLQAWARDVRYQAAAQLASEHEALVAAGHTATDQVETILYRLASSPSRRALLGMRAHEGNLIRPLLDVTREQTAGYCTARDLAWREDETNATGKYARGRVRNDLVPALREIHPGAERNVLALAEILRDEAAVLDALVDEVLDGAAAVPLATLHVLPAATARLVVQRLADAVQGRPAPGAARRLPEILALRLTGTTHLDLPNGVRATAVNGLLSFGPTPELDAPVD